MGVRIAVAHEGVKVGRAEPATTRGGIPSWLLPVLRIPLFAKLAGANALIILAALGALWIAERSALRDAPSVLILGLALVAGVVVNLALVRLALRPLGALEATAERVWSGDLDARVPPSPLADGNMMRIGLVTNRLLERLNDDRERVRQLASKVISAQDEERARVARELHDSAAQTLAALVLQLTAAARDSRDAELAERLALIRKIAGDVLEEIRDISKSMHPRVLDDLGLPAALEHLARQTAERTDVPIEVESELPMMDVPSTLAATLYRVAQEAITNAVRHSGARLVRVRLGGGRTLLRLTVEDDGRGFDVARAEAERPGMGLFSMRERVALVDGSLQIDATRGRGTRIVASVPVTR